MLNYTIKKLLAGCGKTFANRTPDSDIGALLQTLYPVRVEADLIRLGPKCDGGYLVPDDLSGLAACFSAGVSTESGFELDCAERGIHCYLADGSVDGPAERHPLMCFDKKFIGAVSAGGYWSLERWVSEKLGEKTMGDLMLQMDIEGFEYESLLSAPESLLKKFRIMVVEFHNLCGVETQPSFDLIKMTFQKLLQTHFCVHIHPNNDHALKKIGPWSIPPLLEFTFLRKDRAQPLGFSVQFPHQLDIDCTSRRPLLLPECWYSPA
ncbi:hypothetical protein [Rosistilla oblonga]|uniref:hypothetical protein n=1 Tax=Rosistilla oblonga TaxID=2527990 RepID=UPI003A982555